MRLSDENTRKGRHLTPEERIALQAEEIKQLQQENKQLKKERDQAIRDIDKGNCRSCVYDGKKICYGNMHGKDREVAKEQGLPYCRGWQWRGLEGRE
jgi:hypothetical protein